MLISKYTRSVLSVAVLLSYFCNNCLAQIKPGYNPKDTVFNSQKVVLFADDFSGNIYHNFPKGWRSVAPCNQQSYVLSSNRYCYVEKAQDTFVLVIKPVPGKTLENWIEPDLKLIKYLPDSFTLEYDFMLENISASCDLNLHYLEGECTEQLFSFYNKDSSNFTFRNYGIRTSYADGIKTKGFINYKGWIHAGRDHNVWHHFAMSYHLDQINCYLDNRLIYHLPNCGYIPTRFNLSCANGYGEVKFANIRLATGDYLTLDDMTDFRSLLTEKKLITYAIHFDVNSAKIKTESFSFLEQFAIFLADNPIVRIEIGGYTDNDGTDTSNLLLSKRRSEAVRAFLISRGIKEKRLVSRGYGKSQPIAPNILIEDKAINRRVEFKRI